MQVEETNKDILGFQVSPNDVVVCNDVDDAITLGLVVSVTPRSCIVRKFFFPQMGEEKYTIASKHLCVIDKTRLDPRNGLHGLILKELNVLI